MKKIVVIGSINTDMVVRSPQIPSPGQTLMGHSFISTGGGKGANQAVAAARLGGDVVLIGKVGNDDLGKTSIKNFEGEKINTAFIYADKKQPSGVAFIVIDEKGENIIVVAPGANAILNEDDLKNAAEEISKCDVVLFQLEIPLVTVEAGMKLAKHYKKTVILNPAPAAELPDEILSHVDIIIPNQSEAFILTNIVVSDLYTASKACDVLHNKGIETVIITMGESGAYVSCTQYKNLVPGFKAGKTVDTVAAGDTFCGALAIALAERKEMEEAVKFANAAAAISVTRNGAQDSAPYRNEVDEFLRKQD
jgi:ribokinase